jgi:hypothetical protein
VARVELGELLAKLERRLELLQRHRRADCSFEGALEVAVGDAVGGRLACDAPGLDCFERATQLPVNLAEGASGFDRILAGRAAGSLTRHRVLYQKGLVLEQLEGRTDEALKTYMDVVQRAAGSSRGDWKAVELCGFGALRILEKRGEWRAAKQLAERIARLGGPRAEEAAERAKTLGLEHFIWDE